jgi:SAM-dependent methyltransferase
MKSAHEHNRRAWNERVSNGLAHTEPARDKDFQAGLAALAPKGWINADLDGRRVLCLAAGGGKHSVLFAALGAIVTVVDLSPRMLDLDRKAAAARGLRITTIEASMDNLSMLEGDAFELVLQPVSTCYVPDVVAVYLEIARVIRPGGLYISQHKQPASLQSDSHLTQGGYVLRDEYYRKAPLADIRGSWQHRESGTMEYLHRVEELLGGMCRAGFVIEDIVEPRHADDNAAPGTFAHRSRYLPPFVAVKARRRLGGSVVGRSPLTYDERLQEQWNMR